MNSKYTLPNNIIYLSYPIVDKRQPASIISILSLIQIITSLTNKPVYLHCRGGHGRSAVVAICLYLYLYKINNLTPNYDSIVIAINNAHQSRKIMADRWRRLGVPQTKSQKQFCLNFYRYLGY